MAENSCMSNLAIRSHTAQLVSRPHIALFLEMEAEITRLRNCLASIIAAYDRAQEQDEEFGSSISDEAAMDAAREEMSTGSG
jgi:hypothetical protein